MQFFGWWKGHLAEAMPFLFPDPDRTNNFWGRQVDDAGNVIIGDLVRR